MVWNLHVRHTVVLMVDDINHIIWSWWYYIRN